MIQIDWVRLPLIGFVLFATRAFQPGCESISRLLLKPAVEALAGQTLVYGAKSFREMTLPFPAANLWRKP